MPGSTKTIKQEEFISKILLLLQGIPSEKVFELEQTVFTFSINSNMLVGDLSCNKDSLNDICS